MSWVDRLMSVKSTNEIRVSWFVERPLIAVTWSPFAKLITRSSAPVPEGETTEKSASVATRSVNTIRSTAPLSKMSFSWTVSTPSPVAKR